MAAIYKERTARKQYACARECGDPIEPGEQYVMCSLTPNDPDVGNLHWWNAPLHGRSFYDCPRHAQHRPPA